MFCLVMEGPGDEAGLVRKLRKGNSYRLTMRWLNSNGHVDPNWYCWQAQIDGLPKTPSYESYSGVRLEGNETIF